MMYGPAGLLITHSSQKRRCVGTDIPYRPPSDRALYVQKNAGDGIVLFAREDQHVDVLGHDDIRPEIKGMFIARRIDGFDEPFPRSIPIQEWLSTKAAERERVRIAGNIVAFAGFALAAILLVVRNVRRRFGWKWRSHRLSMVHGGAALGHATQPV
jgi:hypothetical protein